jgi:hypothetical protein
MNTPAASVWLDAWERGMSAPPARRPVLLLETVHGPDAQPARWPQGRLEAALLELRAALFGGRMESLASCPKCGEAMEFTLHAHELLAAAPSSLPEHVEVNTAEFSAAFRLPSIADSEAAARVPAAQRRRFPLKQCLAGGCEPEGGWPEEFIAAAAQAMSTVDPLGDLSMSLTCPACAHGWNAAFDSGDFLWSELHAWATRLMQEVAALAAAYGWTEPEILALPPHRRRFYLECLTPRTP